jgi:hypothetical protein
VYKSPVNPVTNPNPIFSFTPFLHSLLNVLVQTANKMGLQKKSLVYFTLTHDSWRQKWDWIDLLIGLKIAPDTVLPHYEGGTNNGKLAG